MIMWLGTPTDSAAAFFTSGGDGSPSSNCGRAGTMVPMLVGFFGILYSENAMTDSRKLLAIAAICAIIFIVVVSAKDNGPMRQAMMRKTAGATGCVRHGDDWTCNCPEGTAKSCTGKYSWLPPDNCTCMKKLFQPKGSSV